MSEEISRRQFLKSGAMSALGLMYFCQGVFDEFPKAKRYWDFRKMFDEMGPEIDAVIVATPDHTHAIIAADAMTMGKHVFVQKPLTHSVYESRLLTKLAGPTGEARILCVTGSGTAR